MDWHYVIASQAKGTRKLCDTAASGRLKSLEKGLEGSPDESAVPYVISKEWQALGEGEAPQDAAVCV